MSLPPRSLSFRKRTKSIDETRLAILRRQSSFTPSADDVLMQRFTKGNASVEPNIEGQATLTLPNGEVIHLPIYKGTYGPPVIDVRTLYSKSGHFTFDPGFTSTASCRSNITFIDGGAGSLLYRGYDITELANDSDFYDVSYLLLYGELPDEITKTQHALYIRRHAMVHEKLIQFYHGFKSDAHPMAIMVGVVGALSAFYHDSLDVHASEDRFSAVYRLIAKMPTIAAMAYKTSIGQPIVYPRNDLNYAENLLYMMFGVPTEPYVINPVLSNALETWLILHLDHEQNASTSTVRIAGSSFANPYACIASGITTLWGPAHGGANEAVLQMLDNIACKSRITEFLQRAKDKKDSFRLMGFGHRVYKNYDPRARIMCKVCHTVLDEMNIQNDPMLELALELEKEALQDPYFIERKLAPNVDFYSGIMLRAMGIPRSMFTVLFAVARTVGWIANWREMISDPQLKIGRPRQLYLGSEARKLPPRSEPARSVAAASRIVDTCVRHAH